VAAAIEAGMCFVNSQNVRDLRQPFGGTKASGTGREGGTWSYEVFLEPKNIAVSLGSHHIPALGRLRALGMATAHRSTYAPDVPTLAEQGLKLESNSWNGVLAPRATPDAVVQRLNAEIQVALKAPAVVKAFEDGGIAALPGPPDRFAAFIASEIDKYAQVIRSARITV
jgi:hypothetical protein